MPMNSPTSLGSASSPQIAIVASQNDSLNIQQITVTDGSQAFNVLSAPVVIPAGKSMTFNLQKNGVTLNGSSLVANASMSTGSNPNNIFQVSFIIGAPQQ